MTKVAVFGAGGRMGATVCRAVMGSGDLDLVAAIDPGHENRPLEAIGVPGSGLVISADPAAVTAAGAEVMVDFTHAAAAGENLRWCAAAGVHAVVGTTGFSATDREELERLFGGPDGPNLVLAPNFAIGAVLMMRFAELAAPFFETAEVIELHHDGKVDAPSGTAMLTVERMAAASGDWAADPTRSRVIEGARGGPGPGGIRVHSVRLRGLVAHQEVLLGTEGQTLTIRHDSLDRTSFMPGVLLAVRQVAGRPGVTIGLDPLLGI